jgi:DNA polymerase-3 subunit beta
MGVHIKDVEILETGEPFLVNGANFAKVVKGFRKGPIKLQADEDNLYISQNRSRFTLPIDRRSVDRFFFFDSQDELKQVELPANNFLNGLKSISMAIDQNIGKYEFRAGLLEIDGNQINLVGTDSRRLMNYTFSSNIDDEVSLLIPKTSILEILKIFDSDFQVLYSNEFLVIKSENESDRIFYFTRLIDGRYVDWRKVIPTDFESSFVFETSEFLDGLRAVLVVNREVRVRFSENAFLLSTSDESGAKVESEVALIKTESFDNSLEDIWVDGKFIQDFLNIASDKVRFHISRGVLLFEDMEQPMKYITMVLDI